MREQWEQEWNERYISSKFAASLMQPVGASSEAFTTASCVTKEEVLLFAIFTVIELFQAGPSSDLRALVKPFLLPFLNFTS